MSLPKNKWTQEEERELQKIMEEKKGNRWSSIAKELQEKFPNLQKKNGKQCRDRYINNIQFKNHGMDQSEWGKGHWDILLEKYFELGPKWSEIAVFLPGNPENRIKNKFYGLIRKILKLLNEGVKKLKIKEVKSVKSQSLTRILRYGPNDWEDQPDISARCLQLKKNLINIFFQPEDDIELVQIGRIVGMIHDFNLQSRCTIMRNSKKKIKKTKAVVADRKNPCSATQMASLISNFDEKKNQFSSHDRDNEENPNKIYQQENSKTMKSSLSEKIYEIGEDELELPNLQNQSRSPFSIFPNEVCQILEEEYEPEFFASMF